MRRRTGCALKRRGRFIARITLHYDPPQPSGEPRRVELAVTRSDGKAITAAYARDFAHRAQALYDETRVAPGGSAQAAPTGAVTVLSWVETWLAKQTYTEAPRDLLRVQAWLPRTRFASRPVGQVTPQLAAAWLTELRRLPSKRGKAPAPRSIRNVMDPVARALRAAVFEGLLAADPFAALPSEVRPKSVDVNPAARRDRRLSRGQLETLLHDDGNPDARSVLYHLLALSGVRLGEGVGLRWCDLRDDAPLARIVVAEQWHQRLKARTSTKTDAVREIPAHPVLAAALAWWRTRWPVWYGRAPTPTDLIVPARDLARRGVGGARRQAAVWRDLRRDLARSGLPVHCVHDLRHTFVSLCADAGMAAEVASRWTHTPSGTSARHLYLTPSWARQCAEMLKLEITARVWPEGGGTDDGAR